MKLEETTKEEFIKTIESVLTVKSACSKHGLSRQTVYRWMRDDKKFAKEVKEAMKNAVLDISDECEARIINRINADDTNAMKFWLRYHHPDYKQSYIVTKLK